MGGLLKISKFCLYYRYFQKRNFLNLFSYCHYSIDDLKVQYPLRIEIAKQSFLVVGFFGPLQASSFWLKENVIIGKLIPAGTGMMRYRSVKLNTDSNIIENELANTIEE